LKMMTMKTSGSSPLGRFIAVREGIKRIMDDDDIPFEEFDKEMKALLKELYDSMEDAVK